MASVAAGCVLVLFLAARATDVAETAGRTVEWTREVGQATFAVAPWVVAAPALVWWGMAGAGRRLTRWSVLPVGVGVLMAIALYSVIATGLSRHLGPRVALAHVVRRLTVESLAFDLAVVLGLLAVGRALRIGREQRARELREVQLQAANAELRRTLGEAQLQALAARVKPHFLYNALNAAIGLMRRQEVAEATEMLTGIAALFRRSSASSRLLISLDDELEMIGAYLTVERYRFGERLTVTVEATPAARAIAVPSLLLQPLVENAIRHGVAECEGPARIEIAAEVVGDGCVITVANDGPGVDATRVDPGGEGLRITRELLRLHYAGDARLDLVATGTGSRVTVIVPTRAG